MTKEDLDQWEAELKAHAAAYSREITPTLRSVPAFYSSELAIRLLLANLLCAPVEIFERARQEHRDASHSGADGDDSCQACGYLDAAVYQAKTGRSLAKDFLEA